MSRLIQILYTTTIYLVMMVSSIALIVRAEHHFDKNHKWRFLLLSAIAILIPSLLAAFRGENVGNDLSVYAQRVYNLTKSVNTVPELLLINSRFEIGYLVVGFISSRIFRTFHMMLFLTQLLIITPIFLAAHKLRKRLPAWAVMFCFYCFFYVATFNIMREGISAAFVFLSFIELLENKKIKAIALFIIAFFFHSTAIIGFALMAFILFFRNIKSRLSRISLLLAVISVVLLLLAKSEAIFFALARYNIIPARYISTYSSLIHGGNTYLNELFMTHYIELFVKWIGFFIPLAFYKDRRNLREDSFFYVLLIGLLTAMLINTGVFVLMHSSYGYRIAIYLEFLFILWMPAMAPNSGALSLRKMPIKTAIMILASFSAFLILYIWRGSHGTFPLYFQIYNF